jgi:hypothetical protein
VDVHGALGELRRDRAEAVLEHVLALVDDEAEAQEPDEDDGQCDAHFT